MKKKKYLCPKCHQKKAYPSQSYPEILVCFCNDNILKEVGHLNKKDNLPDIDLDIESSEEVKKYINERYGQNY